MMIESPYSKAALDAVAIWAAANMALMMILALNVVRKRMLEDVAFGYEIGKLCVAARSEGAWQ